MSVRVSGVYLVPPAQSEKGGSGANESGGVVAAVTIVTPQRSNSLDYLNFEEKRQLIASSLSLSDFLQHGQAAAAKGVAATKVIVGDLASKQWKLLRQEFSRKVRNPKSGDPGPEEAPHSWPYFDSLLFLKDQFTPRASESNLSNSLTQETDHVDETSSEYVDVDDSTYGQEDPFLEEGNGQSPYSDAITDPSSSKSDHRSKPSTPNSSISEESNTTTRTKTGYRRRISPQIALGQSLLAVERERLELRKRQSSVDPNDDDIGFFNSIMPFVKKLDSQKKMIFRMQVQKCLYDLSFSQNQPSETHSSIYQFVPQSLPNMLNPYAGQNISFPAQSTSQQLPVSHHMQEPYSLNNPAYPPPQSISAAKHQQYIPKQSYSVSPASNFSDSPV